MIELQGQSFSRSEQSPFTHSLQHLDGKARRSYPLEVSKNPTRIIVVPNSDHEHALCLMAATYQSLEGQLFDKVILISQAGSSLFHGVALPLVVDEISWKGATVQVATLEKLSQHRLFSYYQAPFCNKIYWQLQCAFFDFYLKGVALVPLVVGKISEQDAYKVAKVIADSCTLQTLIIFSVDVAHHQNIVNNEPLDQSKNCKVYDQDACRVQVIQSPDLLQKASLFGDESASSFALLFELLELPNFKNLESLFVGYTTSYADHIESADIESYAAFIMQHNKCGYKNIMSRYEQSQLLQCARLGIRSLFEVSVPRSPCMISYEMTQPYGVFASLYRMTDHGTVLRGCMGKVQSKLPLHTMVYQMTKQAASKDLRFYPLRYKDLDDTIISLSMTVNVKKIRKYNQITALDGIMLQYDDKIAVSLPSLTFADNWSYQSSLINLSEQIDDNRFLWKKPRAEIFTFQSLAFQEE